MPSSPTPRGVGLAEARRLELESLDRIIIDDPLTEEQSRRSPVEREAVNLWFERTISSRGREARIVVVMRSYKG